MLGVHYSIFSVHRVQNIPVYTYTIWNSPRKPISQQKLSFREFLKPLSLLAIWNYVCWSQGNKKRKIILVRLELWFPIPFFLKQVCQHLLSICRLVHASFVVFQSALHLKWVSDKDSFNSVLGLQNSTPSLIRPN